MLEEFILLFTSTSVLFTHRLSKFSNVNTGGLLWISEWNALQHPVASAFLALVFSDYMLSSRTPKISCDGHSFSPLDLRKFAMSQVCLYRQQMHRDLCIGIKIFY